MADGFDGIYVATHRQLRGIAESLIAGPQYRRAGTIRLALRRTDSRPSRFRLRCTAPSGFFRTTPSNSPGR